MRRAPVEIIVRVHTLDRPLRRAVDSVLACDSATVLVVAHGLEAAELGLPKDPRIRIVEVKGGVGYPGVASNAGVLHARSDYVGFLDSDDYYEPGAIESLHSRAKKDSADVVLAPLKISGQRELLPLTLRRRNLDAARDRLFYRTAPLGLVRRETLQAPDFLFDEEVLTGEDMRVSALLYTKGLRVSCHPEDPAYVVGSDAPTRVTTSPLEAQEAFAAIGRLFNESFIGDLPPRVRRALTVKVLRVHILKRFTGMPPEGIPSEDVLRAQEVIVACLRHSPDALSVFSRGDAVILGALKTGDPETARAALKRRSGGLAVMERVLPRNPLHSLSRESNLRNFLTGKILQYVTRWRP